MFSCYLAGRGKIYPLTSVTALNCEIFVEEKRGALAFTTSQTVSTIHHSQFTNNN